MLNMKVLDYKITSDENSVSVTKTRVSDKTNKAVDVLVGYYPTLSMALRGIQKNYAYGEGTDIQSIKDYKEALEQIDEAFNIELEKQD